MIAVTSFTLTFLISFILYRLVTFRRLNANYQLPIAAYPKLDNIDSQFPPHPQYDYNRPPSPGYGAPLPFIDSTGKKLIPGYLWI